MSTGLYLYKKVFVRTVAIPCRELGGCQLISSIFISISHNLVAIPCRELGGCQRGEINSFSLLIQESRHSLSGIRGMSMDSGSYPYLRRK